MSQWPSDGHIEDIYVDAHPQDPSQPAAAGKQVRDAMQPRSSEGELEVASHPARPTLRQRKLRKKAMGRMLVRLLFLMHLGTFVAIVGMLWVINALTDFGDWWAIWPTVGWGSAVALHGILTLILLRSVPPDRDI